MSTPYQPPHKHRLNKAAIFVIAVLVAIVVFTTTVLLVELQLERQQREDATVGNSVYVAVSGVTIPAYLESGATVTVGRTPVSSVRSLIVNPGKCYIMDGSKYLTSKGTLPNFYLVGAGSHWIKGC